MTGMTRDEGRDELEFDLSGRLMMGRGQEGKVLPLHARATPLPGVCLMFTVYNLIGSFIPMRRLEPANAMLLGRLRYLSL